MDGRLHGIGIGCFVESSGAGPAETARIVVRGPGRVELYTGCASSGQGHETVMAQILADALAVPFEWIRVFHGSTNLVAEGWGTYHSRAVVVGGSAVVAAATALQAQLVALAATRTGLDASALACRGCDVHRRDGEGEGAVLTLATAAAEAPLDAVGKFTTTALTYTYGAHVAHVAVDPETGTTEVLRLVTVEDVGRAINPALVHGQALGSAVQGLGGAFLEELVYDETGQLVSGTLADYALPTAADFPRIESITLETAPSTSNPLGAKGAGEGGIVATGAAAANAVAAALAATGAATREHGRHRDRSRDPLDVDRHACARARRRTGRRVAPAAERVARGIRRAPRRALLDPGVRLPARRRGGGPRAGARGEAARRRRRRRRHQRGGHEPRRAAPRRVLGRRRGAGRPRLPASRAAGSHAAHPALRDEPGRAVHRGHHALRRLADRQRRARPLSAPGSDPLAWGRDAAQSHRPLRRHVRAQ